MKNIAQIKRFSILCIALLAILINPCAIKKSFLAIGNSEATYALNSISNNVNSCQVNHSFSNKKQENQRQIINLKTQLNFKITPAFNQLFSRLEPYNSIKNNSPPIYILYQSLKLHLS